MSLRIKFLLLFLFVGLMPLGLVGGYSLVRVGDAVRSSTHQNLESLGMEVGREIQRVVNEAYNAIHLLAQNQVLLSDAGMAELSAELARTDRFYPIIKDLTLLDLSGEVRASVHHFFRGNWTSTSWYRQARSGESLLSNVHALLHPYQVVMTVAVPVRGADNGAVRNVLIGQIAMERVWDIIHEVSLGPGGQARIVDNRGLVVASSASDEEILRPLAFPQLAESIISEGAGVTQITVGTKRVAAYLPVDQSQDLIRTNWHIVLTQPVAEAYSVMDRLREGLLWNALLSLLTVLLLAALISQHISRRIFALVQGTQRLGDGDFDTHLDDLGKDEIGDLGRALNRTADALTAYDREIRHYQQNLQELVDSRTADLQAMNLLLKQEVEERRRVENERGLLGEQLRQSQKMEAVGTLAGGIAHDFNNMLQAIASHVQLLQKHHRTSGSESVILDPLVKIDTTVSKAKELVDRLLTFSRRGDSRQMRINLNKEVRDVVALLQHTLPRVVQIEVRLEPELADVQADPVQMEQVLVNLANNARDAMPKGGTLLLQTENVVLNAEDARYLGLAPGRHVRLTVADTGNGMDEETRQHIFEPFFTTKDIGKGTGLGLSMVYGIVQDHKGAVTCSSKPGEGATFMILLAALAADTPADFDSGASASKCNGKPVDLSGTEVILVVDDEEMIREATSELLTGYGYTVIQSGDGRQALERYTRDQERIALVITDVGMPGMGGEALLAELRKLNPRAKVIISSGYAGIRDNQAFQAASGMISKPFALNDLLRLVRQVLDHPNPDT
ncbi:Cache domain-containing protein [Desulfonatronum thiosulfatophilum]|uniref:histidine kinase n=1 Tax=Desulfonatronum thiosulfatophilum TaxID=617002 RepID=A0A1G6A439_9BACT|nr:ATP-binding protein [Desulfonatronum thiosulfatophilum]SDB03090.1 Cache domain-containing protein [Desulfonatronum thiosulfatophilum]